MRVRAVAWLRSCADRQLVVAENRTVIGGLGEAVAALLMRSGVHPAFPQIALPDELDEPIGC
jgi:transketolase C-terminal domain/subunit